MCFRWSVAGSLDHTVPVNYVRLLLTKPEFTDAGPDRSRIKGRQKPLRPFGGEKKGDVLSWVLLESYMDEHKRGMGHEGAGLPCRYLHGGVV